MFSILIRVLLEKAGSAATQGNHFGGDKSSNLVAIHIINIIDAFIVTTVALLGEFGKEKAGEQVQKAYKEAIQATFQKSLPQTVCKFMHLF